MTPLLLLYLSSAFPMGMLARVMATISTVISIPISVRLNPYSCVNMVTSMPALICHPNLSRMETR